MPTTITIAEETRKRLSSYKRGDLSFDDVLNVLMDRVRVEDIAAEQIAEHYRRLASFKAVSINTIRRRLEKRLRAVLPK